MKKINFTETFLYKGMIVNYNRIKLDVNGNPIYQYSIVDLLKLFNNDVYTHELYTKQSYNIVQDIKEIIDLCTK